MDATTCTEEENKITSKYLCRGTNALTVVRILLILWGGVLDVIICLSSLASPPCKSQDLGQSGCATLERYSAAWMVACLAIMRVAAGLRPRQGAAWIAGFLSCFVELAWQYHTNITVAGTTPVVPTIVLACFIVMMLVVWPKAHLHCRKCSGGEDKQASFLADATMV